MASPNTLVKHRQSVDTGDTRYEVAPGESPSEAVLTAVADATGRPAAPFATAGSDPDSDPLPPLFEAIDADALDALAGPESAQGNCLVTFTYAGCTVNVEERAVTVSTRT